MKQDLAPLHAEDPESDLVLRLRALAQRAETSASFTLDWKGVAIAVRHIQGSGSELQLRVAYPSAAGASLRALRPMAINLRREDDFDRKAVKSGIAVETQTGDAAFDAAVYIDTPSPAEITRCVLAPTEVRAAALELLREGVRELWIDDPQGEVLVSIHATAHFNRWRRDPELLLDLLATLATHLPPVDALPGRQDLRRPLRILITTSLVASLSLVFAVSYAFARMPAICRGPCDSEGCELRLMIDPICWRPHGLGVATAAVLSAVGVPLLARVLRGGSNSHRVMGTFLMPLLIALSLGELVGMIVYWGHSAP